MISISLALVLNQLYSFNFLNTTRSIFVTFLTVILTTIDTDNLFEPHAPKCSRRRVGFKDVELLIHV